MSPSAGVLVITADRRKTSKIRGVSDPSAFPETYSPGAAARRDVLEAWAAEVRQDRSRVENLTLFQSALEGGLFTNDDLSRIGKEVPRFYNRKLSACFPNDAFSYLQAALSVAEFLPSSRTADLQSEWRGLLVSIGMDSSNPKVSTLEAFRHFRYLPREQFPDYEKLVEALSNHLNETLRQAKALRNADLLNHAVSVFRVLGYLHKHQEGTHYYCPDEYDVMTRFGVDKEKFLFRRLRAEEAAEPDFDHNYSQLQEAYGRSGVKNDRFNPPMDWEGFKAAWRR